jgi:hypothetical protein
MITKYNNFEDRKVISYDFDGVLHTDTYPGTIDPIDYWTKQDWTPSKKIFRILRKEFNSGNKIIVVSARGDTMYDLYKDGLRVFDFEKDVKIINISMKYVMMKFFKKYKLPIEEIILTDNRPKKEILLKMKAIRHYDDNIELEQKLKNTNIEFVFVQKDEIIKRYDNKIPSVRKHDKL